MFQAAEHGSRGSPSLVIAFVPQYPSPARELLSILRFDHEFLPQRVCLASGQAPLILAREVERLGGTRVMVIASPSELKRADRVTADLPVMYHHRDVVMHVPVELAERARAAATEHRVNLLVSVGGGSATGLAKAVALTSGLPIVAVPTTYAGSEATTMWGLTHGNRKTTGVDARVLPRAVVYDAELTLSLPVALSVASGLNALAHGVDSMWGPRADTLDQMMAQEGIRALTAALPDIVSDPMNLTARERALYGAYVSAAAFCSAGSGLHHKICHVLGGAYNLPHAQTHAIMLPYVLAFNGNAAPEAEARIAAALASTSALEGLQELRSRLGVPCALGDYGFNERDIGDAVDRILPVLPAGNPRPINADDLRRLLTAAWQGADPRTIMDDSTKGTENKS